MKCNICRAPIFVAVVANTGTKIPVDVEPYTDGEKRSTHVHNILLLDKPYCEIVSTERMYALEKKRHPLYRVHYATCTDKHAWQDPRSVCRDLVQR